MLSSCCHVSVLLALRFHCPLGMSQGYLAFHLKVPVTFCQVLSALVVQTETSGWREPIALENYSNDSRCHCWAGVFAKCFLWTTRCHCAVILCAPSRSQEEFHFHPKSNFSAVFFISPPWLFLLSLPRLCKFYPILSFWPLTYAAANPIIFFFPHNHAK